MRKTFVRTKVALVVESPTNVTSDDFRHGKNHCERKPRRSERLAGEAAPISKPAAKMTFFLGSGMLGLVCDDVHRQEANYLQVVHVDYHDYD